MIAPRARPEFRIWTVWAGVGLCLGLALGNVSALGFLLLPAVIATILLAWQVGVRREAWGVVVGIAVLPLAMLQADATSLAASGMVLVAGLILYVLPPVRRRL